MTTPKVLASFALGLSVLGLILFTMPPTHADSAQVVRWVTPQDRDFTLERFDPKIHHRFERLSVDSNWTNVLRYAAVLTNKTNHSIESLVVQWTVKGADGAEKISTNRILSATYNNPVVRPHSQALVFPSGVLDAELLSGGFAGSRPHPASLEAMDRAKTVSATIDVLMFDNGLLVGRDTQGLETALRQRSSAAHALLRTIRTESKVGGDVNAAVDRLLGSDSNRSLVSFVHLTKKYSARGLLPEVVTYLEALPEPPATIRRR